MVHVQPWVAFRVVLASVTAPELGAVTIKEAIARAGLATSGY